jgi:hypothetical protein
MRADLGPSAQVVGVKQPARYRNLMLNSHSTPAPSEVGVAPVKKSSLKRTSGAKPSGASRAKVTAEAAPEAQGPGAPRDEWAVLGLFEAEVFRVRPPSPPSALDPLLHHRSA